MGINMSEEHFKSSFVSDHLNMADHNNTLQMDIEWVDFQSPTHWLQGREIYDGIPITRVCARPLPAKRYFLSWAFLVAHQRHHWRATSDFAKASLYHHWKNMARNKQQFQRMFLPDHYHGFRERQANHRHRFARSQCQYVCFQFEF